jgi:2-keto-4-pentenoate hydratase/2-oxohepta-3-ene-1,7-dioic acid hydratase in catechol pathway
LKVVTYQISSPMGPLQRVGVLRNQEIADVVQAYALYLQEQKSNHRAYETAQAVLGETMLSFIQGGQSSLEAAKIALDFLDTKPREQSIGNAGQKIIYSEDEVELQAPLKPVSIRDSLNCETHFRNCLKVVGLSEIPALFYERPYYYRTSHTAIGGPGNEVPWPSFGEKLDYELEFAAIIGKEGTNIPAERAHEYIFGYTIFNDISIRDYQTSDMLTTMGPSKCKNFTLGNIIGPCITTSDEMDPSDIHLQSRVNGQIWSDSRSTDMYYSFAQLIEFISKEETLYPGEMICSGTMAFGCGLELNRFLAPNDVIELEVEGIGILRNKMIR